MSLRDRDAEKYNPTGGLPCGLATARDTLTDDDRQLLDEWLDVPPRTPGRRSDRHLAELLTDETGVFVSHQTVGHHRRHSCRCYRSTARP